MPSHRNINLMDNILSSVFTDEILQAVFFSSSIERISPSNCYVVETGEWRTSEGDSVEVTGETPNQAHSYPLTLEQADGILFFKHAGICELPKRQFTFLGRSPTRQSYCGFIGKFWIAISKSAQNRQILGQETKICYEPTSRNTRNIPVSSLRLQQRECTFLEETLHCTWHMAMSLP